MARRRLEMVDYGDDPVVDHKGRTKPLYKHRRPPPSRLKRWRPGPVFKMVLGLFPGARLMLTETGVVAGLPYAIIGLIAMAAAIFLITQVGVLAEITQTLRLEPKVELLHLLALVIAVGVFELARLGGALEERSERSRAARAMAGLLLPAAIVAVFAPRMIAAHPRFVEALWFAGLILFVGSVPAAVGSVVDLGRLLASNRAKAILGVVMALLLGAALAAYVSAEDTRRGVAEAASKAGFEILPKILG